MDLGSGLDVGSVFFHPLGSGSNRTKNRKTFGRTETTASVKYRGRFILPGSGFGQPPVVGDRGLGFVSGLVYCSGVYGCSDIKDKK